MIQPEVSRLYKYRAFSDQNLEMLVNHQVFFAAPSTFNDPFDCSIEPIIDKVSGEELIELTVVQFKFFGIAEEETRRRLAPFAGGKPEHIATVCHMIREIEMQNNLHGLGILSLSETNSHPLLWSHYADSHRGFCIEYQRTSENNL